MVEALWVKMDILWVRMETVSQGGDSVSQDGDLVVKVEILWVKVETLWVMMETLGQARDSVGQGHLNVAGVRLLLAFFSVLPPQEQREKTICSVSQALPCCWGLPPCQNLVIVILRKCILGMGRSLTAG